MGLVIPFVSSITLAPLSRSHIDPARCLVDGADMARGLDEGLGQHRGGVVVVGPFPGQAPADQGENVWPEIGDLDPKPDHHRQ